MLKKDYTTIVIDYICGCGFTYCDKQLAGQHVHTPVDIGTKLCPRCLLIMTAEIRYGREKEDRH